MTKSKNPCPLCGGREWRCWYVGSAAALPMSDEHLITPLVDTDDGAATSGARGTCWANECLTCGAVAS